MIEIVFKEEKNKAIALDNNKIIGECDFVIQDNIWNIVHTVVDPAYQGQGIAKKLVLGVIENAKSENIQVIADCSYAKKIIEEYHEI